MKNLLKIFPLSIMLITFSFFSCQSDDENNDDTGEMMEEKEEMKEEQPKEMSIVEFVVGAENYTLLEEAVKYAGLVDALSASDEKTVFAPNDTAFKAWLGDKALTDFTKEQVAQVLLNHVIGGELKAEAVVAAVPTYLKNLASGPEESKLSTYVSKDLMINGTVKITTPDAFDATNGIIHAVDKVIDLPTVVTFATADSNFSTLVSALTELTPKTDFAGILSRTENSTEDELNPEFTVFAPTNDAFLKLAAIPAEDPLTQVLLHHVIFKSNILAGSLTDGIQPSMGNGQKITINLPAGESPVITDGAGNKGSKIIATDVQASNGVIHVIDTVLLPETEIKKVIKAI